MHPHANSPAAARPNPTLGSLFARINEAAKYAEDLRSSATGVHSALFGSPAPTPSAGNSPQTQAAGMLDSMQEALDVLMDTLRGTAATLDRISGGMSSK